MAGKVALVRACEAMRPEDERVCYDPFAVRFVDAPVRAALEKNPGSFRAIENQIESILPGIPGAIVARVRCFDEIAVNTVWAGACQVVILGAGYDTRPYRFNELEQVRVFEVDTPATIAAKQETVRAIFGSLPSHVTYVAADLATEDFGPALLRSGYDTTRRTLFLMEGLIMYLPPAAVDRVFAFIRMNALPGSSVLFDYCPKDDGTGTGAGWQAGRNAAAFAGRMGEPLASSIDGPVDLFLVSRGFSGVCTYTGDELRTRYFRGKNSARPICSIYAIASAFVTDAPYAGGCQ